MIAEEVNRYKNDMLEYFHAREIEPNTNTAEDEENTSSNRNRQVYTTSLAGTTYELEGYNSNESNLAQPDSTGVEDEDDAPVDSRTRLRSTSYDPDQPQNQIFLTEDTTSVYGNNEIPFSKAFQIPSNLVQSMMFK